MIPKIEGWNIVIIGSWNTRILNIAWLAEHVFNGNDVTGYLPLAAGLPTKYCCEGISIIPTEEKLIIQIEEINNDKLSLLEKTASEILGLLREVAGVRWTAFRES